jgi:hypothetical protein
LALPQLHVLDVRQPTALSAAFETIARERSDALISAGDPLLFSQAERIVELAARHRLPAVYEHRNFPEIGGLLSYGPLSQERFQQMAVLNNADPAFGAGYAVSTRNCHEVPSSASGLGHREFERRTGDLNYPCPAFLIGDAISIRNDDACGTRVARVGLDDITVRRVGSCGSYSCVNNGKIIPST